MKQSAPEKTALDHLLVLVACCSGMWCLGMSLIRPNLAAFITAASAVSLIAGYFISLAVRTKKIYRFDSYLWTGLAILAAVLSPFLNRLLPDEGFPFILFAGTWLSWMMILCGFVSWRDQTLLFLSIPCLSVFALVGTFDTYPPATVFFFVFLVCSSLLYARIHKRGMVARATDAGVTDSSLLYRDSWRWMAGPEFALASAAVIVLVSVVVGPLLRFSMQSISGVVRVAVPAPPSSTASTTNRPTNYPDMPVGRGIVFTDKAPIMKVKTQRAELLRQTVFVEYVGNGWGRLETSGRLNEMGWAPRMKSSIKDADSKGFVRAWPDGVPFEKVPKMTVEQIEYKMLTSGLFWLPTPGPIYELKATFPNGVGFTSNGFAYIRSTFQEHDNITVRYWAPPDSVEPGRSVFPAEIDRFTKNFTDTRRIPTKVAEFARAAVAGATTDYEKAAKLKQAIERQCKYTLKPPVGAWNGDVVEDFLLKTKLGYCDSFATSMAVCARAVGLASRYTIGYAITNGHKDDDGYLTVRDKDSHAWAEVYFENAGWVPFDATEGAVVVDSGDDEDNRPWYRRPWAPFAILLGLVVVAGVVVFAVRSFQGAYIEASGSLRKSPVTFAHIRFDRNIRKLTGVTRRFSQTTREYAVSVSGRLGEAAPLVMRAVSSLEGACFGPDSRRDEHLESAKSILDELKAVKLPRTKA